MSESVANGAGSVPVLYSFRRCPYAMRARLAIAASGQRCELREVVLRAKPAGLIAASPKATVPVLVLPDGGVLEQSLDIMQWALALHDPEGWLPRSDAERDDIDALIAGCDGEFKRHLDRYKYPNRYVQAEVPSTAEELAAEPDLQSGVHTAAFAMAHRTAGAAFVAMLDARLAGAGQGLVGGRWSLADAAILPFVRQFAATDPVWFEAQPWPAVLAWLAAFVESARYLAVMDKYSAWRDGTPGVTFPA
jgi:glutathione S-transferase